jgi:hypothetical protein
MTSKQARYLVSHLPVGLLIIYIPQVAGGPLVLNFTPRDVNGKLNVDGMIPMGSFNDIEAAKQAASNRYPVSPDSWEVSHSPFGNEKLEEHAPIVEGHRLRPSHD